MGAADFQGVLHGCGESEKTAMLNELRNGHRCEPDPRPKWAMRCFVVRTPALSRAENRHPAALPTPFPLPVGEDIPEKPPPPPTPDTDASGENYAFVPDLNIPVGA